MITPPVLVELVPVPLVPEPLPVEVPAVPVVIVPPDPNVEGLPPAPHPPLKQATTMTNDAVLGAPTCLMDLSIVASESKGVAPALLLRRQTQEIDHRSWSTFAD